MSEEKREFSELKGTMPNPKTIRCRNCAFRNRDVIVVGEKKIPCGVTRAECDIYQKPSFKPHEIMFNDADCDYYVKDSER